MLRRSGARWSTCAVAGLATLWVAAGTGCGGDSSPQSTATAKTTATVGAAAQSGGLFVSKKLPYQLRLPSGWQVDPASQEVATDADEIVNADATELLVVGYGYLEPGETVSDRVRGQQKDETSQPGCVSEAKQDRPIEVGGQRGILWSYTCAPDEKQLIIARDTYALSAQTIYRRAGHRRVGYRFTVVVPLAKKGQARSLLNQFLAKLTFVKESAATLDE